jgi:hypothetical protein
MNTVTLKRGEFTLPHQSQITRRDLAGEMIARNPGGTARGRRLTADEMTDTDTRYEYVLTGIGNSAVPWTAFENGEEFEMWLDAYAVTIDTAECPGHYYDDDEKSWPKPGQDFHVHLPPDTDWFSSMNEPYDLSYWPVDDKMIYATWAEYLFWNVQRGIRHLDTHGNVTKNGRPTGRNWRDMIDLANLNMDVSFNCIAGQLVWGHACHITGVTMPGEPKIDLYPANLGMECDHEVEESDDGLNMWTQYEILEDVWRKCLWPSATLDGQTSTWLDYLFGENGVAL